MPVNPLALIKLKEKLEVFEKQHPKMIAFINQVGKNAITEGSILEMKVTRPDGKSYVTNMKVTAEDMQLFEMFGELKK